VVGEADDLEKLAGVIEHWGVTQILGDKVEDGIRFFVRIGGEADLLPAIGNIRILRVTIEAAVHTGGRLGTAVVGVGLDHRTGNYVFEHTEHQLAVVIS